MSGGRHRNGTRVSPGTGLRVRRPASVPWGMRSHPERPLAGQHCHLATRASRGPADWRIEDPEAVARGCGVNIRGPAAAMCTSPILGSEGVSVPARRPIKQPRFGRSCVASTV